jgi:integrase
VATIERPEIRSFVAEMVDEGVSPGTARNALNVVKAVLTFTVEAGGLRASPAAGVPAPKGEQHRLHIPTIEQVHALVESIDPQYRMVVLVAAYGGLRAGELHALEVHDIDTMRGRIHVRRSVSEVHGKLHYGPPKWGSTRTVTLPPSVRDELVVHLVPVADHPDALAFTTAAGAPIRQSNFYRRHFRPTADAIGLGCTFHDLRHFCVASLIAAGAHPRAIMERMGHSSITVTLDTYGHLFPTLDEALTDALDAQISEAAADALRPTRGLVAPAVPFRNGTEASEKAL